MPSPQADVDARLPQASLGVRVCRPVEQSAERVLRCEQVLFVYEPGRSGTRTAFVEDKVQLTATGPLGRARWKGRKCLVFPVC